MEAALDLVRLSIDTEGADCSKQEVFEFAKAIANTTILNAPTYGLQWLRGDSEEYEHISFELGRHIMAIEGGAK